MRAIVVVMVMASAASAQPADPPPSEPPANAPAEAAPTPAMLAFQEGRTLLEAGKYEEACAKFTTSIADDPDAPGTLLNLGLCSEKLGKTATALAWYRKAQFRAAETQMTEYEEAAKRQTIVLAAKVPTLRIDAAAGAKVLLDGNELSELDRARLEVDPGTHVIESGNDRREVIMRDGEELTVDMRPPPVRHFVVIDRGVKQRRLAYLAGSVGGALWITSLTVTLVGKSKYDATDHLDVNQHWQNVVRYGGTSLFLLGTAAIGAGAYLYIKAPRRERVEQIAPVVGPNQVGVAVAGSF